MINTDCQIAMETVSAPYCFTIRLAEKNIRIESQYRRVYDQCKHYQVQNVQPDLWVFPTTVNGASDSNSDEPRSAEKDGLMMLFPKETREMETSQLVELAESVQICQEIVEGLIPSNYMLMHGAVVAREGYGYMFTAKSGVGKTTRVQRWMEAYPDSVVVNGDKPLIQICEGKLPLVFGSPWCGKEGWNTNMSVPLRAVFLLERSEENRAERMTEAQAFMKLLPQIHRPADPDLGRNVLRMLRILTEQVAVYRFRSAPTQEAVRLAWETAKP